MGHSLLMKNNLFNGLRRLVNQLLGFFPSALPVGMSEFDGWVDSILRTYNLPTKDRDSLTFALASMIMHLGQTDCRKSKYYFVRTIRAGAAKQIAGAAFQEVKEKQKAAALAKLAEATATSQAVDNGPKV